MGLPVIASDIPAHREFGISVTNDLAEATAMLERLGPPRVVRCVASRAGFEVVDVGRAARRICPDR